MTAPPGPYELRYTRHGDLIRFDSEEYREVLEYFYHFRKGGGDNMAAHIFRCLQKADGKHMEGFYRGFPEYVVIHEQWQRSKSEQEFFESRGMKWIYGG